MLNLKIYKAISFALIGLFVIAAFVSFGQVIDPDAAKVGEDSVSSISDLIDLVFRPVNNGMEFTILISVIFGAIGVPATYIMRLLLPAAKAPVKNLVLMLAATLIGTVLLLVIPGEFNVKQVFTVWFDWAAWSSLVYSLITSIWSGAKTNVVAGTEKAEQ